jgi:uncharacterized protein (TIGR02270 family)
VRDMLASTVPLRRRLGFTACRFHAVDPGTVLDHALGDHDAGVRAEAMRTAGQLGRYELIPACARAISDAHADCRFWAAWAAVLLGNRGVALESLRVTGLAAGPHRARAFRLALQALGLSDAHVVLQQLAAQPHSLRWLIQGSGVVGDASYVPWLITHMADDKTAGLAGEAFSLITGTDLASLELERQPPENVELGPNDDPDDPNVEIDPDEGLPWPDPERIQKWWAANGGRFQPGQRYFMGAPITHEHCIAVLKNGYQRQRILAAHYLCLLDPGTPLFNTSAPAWRQHRALAETR